MKKSIVAFLLIVMSLLLFSIVGCGASDKNSSSAGTTVNSSDSTTVVSGTGVAVKNGDTVNIDFVGTLDGVAFDGGTASGYDLVIGSGSFINGFEDQIIGMKVGEIRNINVTFPMNYQEASLAGKPTVFKVTLNSINGK